MKILKMILPHVLMKCGSPEFKHTVLSSFLIQTRTASMQNSAVNTCDHYYELYNDCLVLNNWSIPACSDAKLGYLDCTSYTQVLSEMSIPEVASNKVVGFKRSRTVVATMISQQSCQNARTSSFRHIQKISIRHPFQLPTWLRRARSWAQSYQAVPRRAVKAFFPCCLGVQCPPRRVMAMLLPPASYPS